MISAREVAGFINKCPAFVGEPSEALAIAEALVSEYVIEDWTQPNEGDQ